MTKDIVEEYSVIIAKDPKTGQILSESWETEKGLHDPKKGFPAYRRWDIETGKIIQECYCKNGELHRDGDKPAKISIDPRTNMLISEEYYDEGVEHRSNGPSQIIRDAATGKTVVEEWKQKGKFHRKGDFPASLNRNVATNVIECEEYYIRGERHRTIGPAFIECDRNTGKIRNKVYFLHGQQQQHQPQKIPSQMLDI